MGRPVLAVPGFAVTLGATGAPLVRRGLGQDLAEHLGQPATALQSCVVVGRLGRT
jgi:hypothetical protein